MLLEAAQQGSLEEVLTVASALSVQDPRERPVERQQAADQAHAQWKDPDSDFAALINLWRGFEEQRQALGSNALRSWCRKNFLNSCRTRASVRWSGSRPPTRRTRNGRTRIPTSPR